ncbi:hypothetical protein [Streptomyces sp. NPDC058424]|uniref:hypothetical protein n=1 Tax=Streptomyces sp. NPDC058424 TaxID=3346491 RepID=UPI00364E7F72
MPPRKRTTAEPKSEDEQSAAAKAGGEEPKADPSAQEAGDAGTSAEPNAEEVAGPKDEQGGPERSSPQTVERPCAECFPNGWPEGAVSVGCTHDTWTRDNT